MLFKCDMCNHPFELKRQKGIQFIPKVCSITCLKDYLEEFVSDKNWLVKALEGKKSFAVFSNISQNEFRSKVEEIVANFFNKAHIEYEFEPYSFMFRKKIYLPDFYLPEYKTFVEIKDNIWEAGAYSKFKLFASKIPLILLTKDFVKGLMR